MEVVEIFQFLKELRRNNNREWFGDNRDRYDITKKQFEDITQKLILVLAKFNSNIGILNPKDCVYRIFRDVRFSSDKSPYKTNYGTYIVPGGRKSGYAGYYLHIEPGNSFLGGGVYHPDKDILKAVREEIYIFPNEFIKIIDKPSFKSHFPILYQDDKLKNAPRGFDKDFEHIDLLKHKSYLAGRGITDEELLSGNLLSTIEESFKELFPFVDFLNGAINLSKQ